MTAMNLRFLLSGRAIACVLALPIVLAACNGAGTLSGSSGGGAGGGGAGGGGTGGMTTTTPTTTTCLEVPQPTFALRVLAASGGPVPNDTTIEVIWSAGAEPPFHLDQPMTWGTLENSNIVCDVDPGAPPPQDLQVLTCALWTS